MVLSEEKKQQVIALGRLGWTLRRIEQKTVAKPQPATSRPPGVPVRPPGAALAMLVFLSGLSG